MSTPPGPWWRTLPLRGVALLTVLAYLPALTAAPGRMPADSKLYLYLDPGRLMVDAAGSFDPRQFAGWVPHQNIAFLWPSGPWFWVFEQLGVPDWIAHRLWIGSLMLAAGLGVRWCARLLGASAHAALAAAVVYQCSLYVLPYVSRTSVMLLPWAGLGWIVGLTVRATRRPNWGDPAAIALVVLTVGAVNATALAMIVPAPLLWLVHAAWARLVSWRQALVVAGRVAVLSTGVSLWWITMLIINGRYGTDVLPYSETLADVSHTSTSAEVWRGLGYWLFYIRDPFTATTSAALRYLTSTVAIGVSFVLPVLALTALVWVRWAHRRFAVMLVAVGVVVAVGVHPDNDRSPLIRAITGGSDDGPALALRSSTRATPVLLLGVALALAAAIDATPATWRTAGRVRQRRRGRAPAGVAAAVIAVAIVNLPALWTGAFVDPGLDRQQHPPTAWTLAAAELDRSGTDGRVLQLPGAEFGTFRWGETVDQPLPGLTDKALVTRDLLPLGAPGAMDLLYALDDRLQSGTLDPAALAPVARLLGIDRILLTNDQAFERFGNVRPETVRAIVTQAAGVGAPIGFGTVPGGSPLGVVDERSFTEPAVARAALEVFPVDGDGVVRVYERSIVVSGNGDGLIDAAAAGLLDRSTAVRYSASAAADGFELAAAIDDAVGVIVTDSNRDRPRQWRTSQDTTGFTEYDDPVLAPQGRQPGGTVIPLFGPPADASPATRPATATTARMIGPVTATATAYGEPFAYLPEHRPAMAVDGDPTTSWSVAEHGDPVGERIRITTDDAVTTLHLLQPAAADARRITEVVVAAGDGTARRIGLGDRSLVPPGQPVTLDRPARTVDITIAAVGGGTPGTAGALAGVGFAEITTDLGAAVEVVRPPHDALAVVAADQPLALVFTRLRVDPHDRWRADVEPALRREFELAQPRRFELATTVRVDQRAPDAALADMFRWPVVASSRLAGSLRHAGVAAFDGDPDTAWITAFDGAEGATVVVAATTAPTTAITLRQPLAATDAGASVVTGVTLRAGGHERVVDLADDGAGAWSGAVTPPLPAGTLSIELTGVRSATTVDRRFGDLVDLPAVIAEIEFPGAPRTAPLGTAAWRSDCLPLLEADGSAIGVSLAISGPGWLTGEPIGSAPCRPILELAAGRHLVTGADADGLPLLLDGIVLDAGVRAAVGGTSPTTPTTATVSAPGRFERTIRVEGCATGCWLVFGEGRNDAWSATVDGDRLGPPVLVDGGFNGWWLPPGAPSRTVTVRWTAQDWLWLALAASLVSALVAVTLVARSRGRDAPPVPGRANNTPPVWSAPGRSVGARRAAVAGVLWVASSAVLIGPTWATAGAAAAVTLVVARFDRLAELTAAACVVAVAGYVTASELRNAPTPDAGWPVAFERIHGVGLFAAVTLLIAAILADDAPRPDPPAEDPHP
ncbi:MAG TPA: alpha-(1-_3)-arabinofuranosyltransferase family protein [Ilumatobacter sp.]